MRIAICDDCREDALALRALLTGHRVSLFSTPAELLADPEGGEGRYDLYLLDIYMGSAPEGITLAKRLRERDEDAGICFVSSSDGFYREAYDLQDVNYLLKPVSEADFRRLIERVSRRRARDRQRSFSYKRSGRVETIPYSNILMITSSGHVLEIYCKDGTLHPHSGKLDDVEALLDADVFLRCHQSFLVNLYQVDHLTGSELSIGPLRVPVSRRYYADVKRRYQEILFEEVD